MMLVATIVFFLMTSDVDYATGINAYWSPTLALTDMVGLTVCLIQCDIPRVLSN